MSTTPLAKLLQRRRNLLEKRSAIDAEIASIDADIFPRIETLSHAIEGISGAVATKIADQSGHNETQSGIPSFLVKNAEVALTGVQAVVSVGRLRPKLLVHEIERVLKGADRPMKTSEILSVLKHQGVSVPGKSPLNNLAAHLSHHTKIFERVSNGWIVQKETHDAEKSNAHAVQ